MDFLPNRTYNTIEKISRGKQAAMIMGAGRQNRLYAEVHNAAFAERGLNKFVVCNADNEILDCASTLEDAKKLKARISNASSVRHEDFLMIQERIVEVRRRALNGIADLQSRGLTFTEDITVQLVGFENVNEFQEAEQHMNPNPGTLQNNDTIFTDDYVPCPITHQTFSVPFRQTGFDYKRSRGLSESTRQVSEKLESMLFNGNTAISVVFQGVPFPLYGYTTHPDRGIGTISDWTVPANLQAIVPELIQQIGLMWATQGGVANNSVMVYVSNDIWTVLSNDYKEYSERTVIDRIRDIPAVLDVKPIEVLADKTVALVEMDVRTVELCIESDIIAVPHTTEVPVAPQDFTTYAAMVPQIKSDSNGQTGIRILSP